MADPANANRLRMNDRFARIEKARPAIPQMAVNITRRINNALPQKSTQAPDAKARLAKRAQKTGRNPMRHNNAKANAARN